MATGKVIGQTQRKHRQQEFLRFLKTIYQATPAELDLHLVLDNYATHKTPAIRRWPDRRGSRADPWTGRSGPWTAEPAGDHRRW